MSGATLNLHAAQKFSRAPALVCERYAEEILSFASAPERGQDMTQRTVDKLAASYGIEGTGGKPFLFGGGIAVIPVWGALLHRDPWCDSWATGYDYIGSRFAAAMGDDDVKGILFDVNSYGGHVSGNFELCEAIEERRGEKPMMALVDSRSLSGGYSISSAVGRIVATPSSDIGSIGVVMMHMSVEKALKNYGIQVNFIYAGKHKVDGNPFQNLPDDVRAAFQASVERSYEKFVTLVARNRGMEPDAVRATEARIYDAEEALSVGLIDGVATPRAAYASFLAELDSGSKSTTKKEVKSMSTEKKAKNGGDEEELSQADIDKAVQEASATAAREQQARIAGILQHAEADGRRKQAEHLAFNTTMSVEEAGKLKM